MLNSSQLRNICIASSHCQEFWCSLSKKLRNIYYKKCVFTKIWPCWYIFISWRGKKWQKFNFRVDILRQRIDFCLSNNSSSKQQSINFNPIFQSTNWFDSPMEIGNHDMCNLYILEIVTLQKEVQILVYIFSSVNENYSVYI